MCLQVGNAFLQKSSRRLICFRLLLQVLVTECVGNRVDDLRGHDRVPMRESEIDEARFLIKATAGFPDRICSEAAGNQPHIRSQALSLFQVVLDSSGWERTRRERQLVV